MKPSIYLHEIPQGVDLQEVIEDPGKAQAVLFGDIPESYTGLVIFVVLLIYIQAMFLIRNFYWSMTALSVSVIIYLFFHHKKKKQEIFKTVNLEKYNI